MPCIPHATGFQGCRHGLQLDLVGQVTEFGENLSEFLHRLIDLANVLGCCGHNGLNGVKTSLNFFKRLKTHLRRLLNISSFLEPEINGRDNPLGSIGHRLNLMVEGTQQFRLIEGCGRQGLDGSPSMDQELG